MPRYYFHLFDPVETHDPEGLELRNLLAAEVVARFELRRLYALQDDDNAKLSDRIDITDERGQVLLSVCYADLA